MLTCPAFTVNAPVQSCADPSAVDLLASGAAKERRVNNVATVMARTRLIDALGYLIRDFIFPPGRGKRWGNASAMRKPRICKRYAKVNSFFTRLGGRIRGALDVFRQIGQGNASE